MTLGRRIARLEVAAAALGAGEDSALTERLSRLLARLEVAVVASGDASDKPDASPMERTVRRYLRGDAEPADALCELAGGCWP